jgi:peptide deformylase
MVKSFNPYTKYASSSDVSLGEFIVEDWKCELVDPRHPMLHKAASTDPFSGNTNWAEREKEMFVLMRANMGIGLAAPQVGSSYNMFVMTHSILGDIGVYKPSIVETEGEVQIEEGCLTWPLLYLNIKRPAKIKVQFTKNDGETVVETWMDGIDARCFLHEYDHLHGKNFIDDVSDFKLRRAKEQRDKRFKKLERRISNVR